LFCSPDYDEAGLEAKLRENMRKKAGQHQKNPNFQADGVKQMLLKNDRGDLDDMINPSWKKDNKPTNTD